MDSKKNNRFKRWACWITGIFFISFMQNVPAQIVSQPSLDFPEKEEAIKVAKATVEAYETGDWDLLRRNLAQDAMIHNLGSFDSLDVDKTIEYWKKGREQAKPVLADDGAWLGISIPDGPREGNWVLHWGTNALSYPNGETIRFPYHVALRFDGEKVDRVHFYYDNNKIIRAMGYEIQPPLKEEEGEGEEELEPFDE